MIPNRYVILVNYNSTTEVKQLLLECADLHSVCCKFFTRNDLKYLFENVSCQEDPSIRPCICVFE